MIPLSLYVHIPWCVKKCPYCDFNSHEADDIPTDDYVDALLADLDADIEQFDVARPVQSIFIGGGTPSLFPADAMARLLAAISRRCELTEDIEITIEANPGTLDDAAGKFPAYLDAGINRLSLGAQSFNDEALAALGRIHQGGDIDAAFNAARSAGFNRINIDLMHGLPGQTPGLAQHDLARAMDLGADHISWYQLTIEANTVFYRRPPSLPDEDTMATILDEGTALLAERDYVRYEISAFARSGQQSRHNLNYWQFGDYLGIGAGAHGKITTPGGVFRTNKTRLPRDYLASRRSNRAAVDTSALPLEFLMNTLRLPTGFTFTRFEERTGLDRSTLDRFLEKAQALALIDVAGDSIRPTDRGLDYLNDLLLIAENAAAIARQ